MSVQAERDALLAALTAIHIYCVEANFLTDDMPVHPWDILSMLDDDFPEARALLPAARRPWDKATS